MDSPDVKKLIEHMKRQWKKWPIKRCDDKTRAEYIAEKGHVATSIEEGYHVCSKGFQAAQI